MYYYYSLLLVVKFLGDIVCLFKLFKVLLENLLCWQDGEFVIDEDIQVLVGWFKNVYVDCEIVWWFVCVLMQDFIGVFVVVDLVVMCEVVKCFGGDMLKVNLLLLVDLVIDYFVMVDYFGDDDVFEENVWLEMECNYECYMFLKWGKQVFSCFSVVLFGIGICYQVNLEYLGKVVWSELQDGEWIVYLDLLVGIDFYMIMINGLGVLGWGVGGIEVEVVMFGQFVLMFILDVVGFKLIGKFWEGIIVIDLVFIVM